MVIVKGRCPPAKVILFSGVGSPGVFSAASGGLVIWYQLFVISKKPPV
jgi:hypothetical protein